MRMNIRSNICVLGWLAGLTVSLMAACSVSDSDLTTERASYALQSAGSAAQNDMLESSRSAIEDDAGATERGENKCEGFPLEGKCAVEGGVSGRHLCASIIGVRFYPCPDGWTCRRDGEFLGCLPE